jgi:hypothetical protein
MTLLRRNRHLLSSLAFSVLFALYLMPMKLLNPYNTSWVFGLMPNFRDLDGHAIGSMFYSSDQWRHPIGIIGNYGAPIGSTTLFWNSNPIFSLIQKILYHLGLIPQLFQFIGIEMAIGIILTGFSAFLLTKKIGGTDIAAVLASCLTALSISLLAHYYNDTLMWQFLVFFAMVLFLEAQGGKLHLWLILAAITLGTQAYFLPIVLVLFGIATLIAKQRRISTIAVRFLSMAALLIFLYYEFGGFLLSPAKRATSLVSAKQLSCTVECLFDSRDFGLFTFGNPFTGGWEGWRYLGASTIFLLLVGLVLWLNQYRMNQYRISRMRRDFRSPFSYLAIICVGFFILSLGPVWQIGHHAIRPPLYGLTDYFFESFRATGRFAIPLVGLLICIASKQIDRLKYGAYPLALVLCCTLVTTQYFEMTRLYESIAWASNLAVSTPLVPREQLGSLFKAHNSIQLVEADSGDIANIPWQEFSYFSLINNYEVDSFHFLARFDSDAAGRLQALSVQRALSCQFNKETIYVINMKIYANIPSSCAVRLTEYPGTATWNYFTFA